VQLTLTLKFSKSEQVRDHGFEINRARLTATVDGGEQVVVLAILSGAVSSERSVWRRTESISVGSGKRTGPGVGACGSRKPGSH
jgi:hypothetical protein